MATSIRTYGKWILVGEHTVIRSGEALAFPIQTKFFSLSYSKSPLESFKINDHDLPHISPLNKSLELGLKLLSKTTADLHGQIEIQSNIPLGSGLGGSASICVAVGKLFSYLGWLQADQLFSFCRELENLFHGKSSGLDIATVLAGQGICFKNGTYSNLPMTWRPNWYLCHSGISSNTSDDVNKVNNLFLENIELAQNIDKKMQNAVLLAKKSLLINNSSGLSMLSESMDLAAQCFAEWNIVPEKMQHLALELKSLGALAVKPTGSGGGGYLLALWSPDKIPSTKIDLLSVYA